MKIFVLFFLTVISINAQTFSGIVLDKSTDKPLQSVTVRIKGTAFGTFTDNNGKFIFKKLSNGNKTAIVSMVGYETKIIKFTIERNKNIFRKIYLNQESFRTTEVIVSANKTVQAVQDVPVSVSTINQSEISIRNLTDIDKALEYIPGLKMNGSQVDIRGSSGFAFGVGSRVAYLLDGFPMLSGDQGDMKFDIIPMYSIKQIEVVKGAGSALYGTGALGGIINIITRDNFENCKINAKAYSGFYTKPKYKQWIYQNNLSLRNGIDIGYSDRIGKFGYLLSGRFLNDNSYRNFDDRTNINAFTKFIYSPNDRNNFTLSTIFASDNHADWVYWRNLDSATIPPANTDKNTRLFSKKISTIGQYKHIFDEYNFLTYRIGMYHTSFENNLDINNSDFRSSKANSLYNELQMNSNFSYANFTYGATFLYNTVDANIYGNEKEITASTYAQFESEIINNLILTAGGRFDFEKTLNYNDNKEISPKIGLSYQSDFGINLRASIGKGFRTATIAEKFASINYGPFKVKPNPNLEPESSWSYEIGGNYEFYLFNSKFLIDCAIFQNQLYNMIEAQFITSNFQPYIQFNNLTRAKINGIEIDIKSFISKFIGLETSLTYINPKDLELNQTLKYRSKILWYSRIFVPLNNFKINLDYRFMSRIDEVDELLDMFIQDASKRVNAHIVDVGISYNLEKVINSNLSLSLIVKNLLDYYYTEYPGNLAPTRNITLQIELQM